MNVLPGVSSETIAVLRNCDLPGGKYTESTTGKTTYFVRCIPYLVGQDYAAQKAMTHDQRRDVVLRVLADLRAHKFDAGCVLSNNPEFGGDYLRVECRTRVHDAICYMKS